MAEFELLYLTQQDVIDVGDPAAPVERAFLPDAIGGDRVLRAYLDLVYTVGTSGDLHVLWLDDPDAPC